jgi:protease YdgD
MCARHECIFDGRRTLIVVLLIVFPCIVIGQSDNVESDQSVVRRLLGPYYPENRVRVDARQYPWSAVGRITLFDTVLRPGGATSCSGILVGENLVLTAAHCVWSRRDYPEEVFFLAGIQQNKYVAHSNAKNIYIHEAFEGGEPSPKMFSIDWALIELEMPIGKKTGYVGVAVFDAGVLESMNKELARFKVSGYRGDRLFVQTVDHDCRIDGFAGDGELILHRCPITRGDSGGPLLLPIQGELLVVGIDVGLLGLEVEVDGKQRIVGFGVAVPSSRFRGKLKELGVDMGPMKGPSEIVGRLGWNPKASKGSLAE